MTDTNPNLHQAGQAAEPDQVTRLLEVELERKRAEWKKKTARSRSIRAQSFIALFFLIVGCGVVYFVMMSQLNNARSARQSTPASSNK
jgi:hypothetical protein